MKIAIMGAGGVGGFYGARLARAGQDVTLIARGEHLRAIQQNGLRIESPDLGEFHLKDIAATDDPATIGEADLVWMTVKAYDLEAAAETIRPLVGEETVVIPLQNGVDIAERVGAVLGEKHVMGGAVAVSAAIIEPGLIRHNVMDRLAFGELAGGLTPRGEAIQKVMTDAGIPSILSPDIQLEIWMKFLRLNTFAGMATMIRLPLGSSLGDPDVKAMALECMRETEAVARKKGVALEQGTSEKLITETEKMMSSVKPSMLLDIERGRKLELDVFQGTVVRLGKELGVPTPVNAFIHTALKLHANGSG